MKPPVGENRVVDPAALELQQRARAVAVVDPQTRTVAESAACGELGIVGSSASVGDSGYVGCGDCGCGLPVCVGSLDVGSVRVGELLDLMVDLGEARARLEGMLMTVAAEVGRRNGWEAAAWLMREYNRVPAIQARAEAGMAYTLVAEGRDETLAALSAGEITLSHARVVARAAYKEHARSEADLLELGRVYPSDVVARHMVIHDRPATGSAEGSEGEDDRYGTGPVAEELRAQRDERRARMFQGEDGRWHLSAQFDSITGKRLHQIYQSAMRAMRNRPGSAEHSYPQRAADVVAELFGTHSDCNRQQTSLLVLTDYDHASGHLLNPRLDDGTPIPVEVAAELAVNARVMPVLFDANWQNIAIGTSRNPNEAQRMLLAARDGGCIGCRATVEESEGHHIKFWRNGGLTLVPNLALLCYSCHDLVHEHDYEVHTPAAGRPELRPPEHLRRAHPPPSTNPIQRN
ncbi:MAG: HNH endonuclease signature motif containing protein [bacterium]|nr:HNH endonuclease signature motif containing protein [bacterium]